MASLNALSTGIFLKMTAFFPVYGVWYGLRSAMAILVTDIYIYIYHHHTVQVARV